MDLTVKVIGTRARSKRYREVDGKVLGIDGDYAIIGYTYEKNGETREGRSFVYKDDLILEDER